MERIRRADCSLAGGGGHGARVAHRPRGHGLREPRPVEGADPLAGGAHARPYSERSAADWRNAFSFVLEAYLLQVLPAELQPAAAAAIATTLASNGLLLVIARGREPEEARGEMPWPLTRDELTSLFSPRPAGRTRRRL